MKQLIVVINAKTPVDVHNVLNFQTEKQPITTGVRQLSDTTFLIDAHTSLSFLCALGNSAYQRNLDFFVYEVGDIIQDHVALPSQDQT